MSLRHVSVALFVCSLLFYYCLVLTEDSFELRFLPLYTTSVVSIERVSSIPHHITVGFRNNQTRGPGLTHSGDKRTDDSEPLSDSECKDRTV
jgi:hypothetical protein